MFVGIGGGVVAVFVKLLTNSHLPLPLLFSKINSQIHIIVSVWSADSLDLLDELTEHTQSICALTFALDFVGLFLLYFPFFLFFFLPPLITLLFLLDLFIFLNFSKC